MLPLAKPVIIDNDVISRLYRAGVLDQILRLWPKGTFRVSEQVVEEAWAWPSEGKKLGSLIEKLESDGVLAVVSVDSEGDVLVYAQLRLKGQLGKGESASIAIAFKQGWVVATDDGVARESCSNMDPVVPFIGTGNIVNQAVRNGRLSPAEGRRIQTKMRRQIS